MNDIGSQFTECSYHLYADDVQAYVTSELNHLASAVNRLILI